MPVIYVDWDTPGESEKQVLEATKYITVGGKDVRWKAVEDTSQELKFLLGEILLSDWRVREKIKYGPIRVQANILTEHDLPEGKRLNGFLMLDEARLRFIDGLKWVTHEQIVRYQRRMSKA